MEKVVENNDSQDGDSQGQTVENPHTEESKMLAHLALAEKSRVVMRLGQSLLACGAGAYRIKSAMSRAARAVGLSRLESQVALMEITITAWEGSNFRTEVAENRAVGVNVAKLDRLMVLCVRLHEDMTVAELDAELDRIERQDRHYPIWASALAAAFACAAFTFLNNGRVVECSVVFFAAGLGQVLRRLMLARKINHFAIWTGCAALSALIYIGAIEACNHLEIIEGMHRGGVIGAFLYLIPGFPLTTAILDFVRMDFWSAITRANYSLMVIASAGISMWIVSHILSWPVSASHPGPMPFALLTALQALTSLVAAYGFAVLFNAPWKVALASGLIGAIVNVGRLLLQNYGIPWQLAVGLAAFTAGILATLLAMRTHHSRVSLSVPAVVIMIPGVPFYRALVALNEGAYVQALGPTLEVFFVVMAIGFGLALARTVSDPGWFFDTETAPLVEDLEKTSKSANL